MRVKSNYCTSPILIPLKTPSFDGYGFNLHAEKARPGQFIGKVDPGSPAEAAGMREGDRIVEVNGVNISHENHKQVRHLIYWVTHLLGKKLLLTWF